jgi:hypothetical protein
MQASLLSMHAGEERCADAGAEDQGMAPAERGAAPLQGRPAPTPPPAASKGLTGHRGCGQLRVLASATLRARGRFAKEQRGRARASVCARAAVRRADGGRSPGPSPGGASSVRFSSSSAATQPNPSSAIGRVYLRRGT